MSNRYAMPGENASRVPARLELAVPMREAWSIPGGGLGWRATSVPVLAADGLLFTSIAGQLVALDAESGQRVWAYPWTCSVCVLHDDWLCGWTDQDEVHLIETRTGRPQGCAPCGRPAAVLSVGPHLVVQSERSEYGQGLLSCVDVASGRCLWTRGLPEGSARDLQFAASGDLVVVAQADGEVLALELASGEPRWRRSWPEWGYWDREWFRPALTFRLFLLPYGLIAYVAGHVLCLSLDSGETRWQVDGHAHHFYDGRFYAVSWPSGYEIRSGVDGALLLGAPFAGGAPRVDARGSIVSLVSETHAYAATQQGILLAVERDSGVYAWHHQAKGTSFIAGAPVGVSGRLYYHRSDRLFCLAPKGSR